MQKTELCVCFCSQISQIHFLLRFAVNTGLFKKNQIINFSICFQGSSEFTLAVLLTVFQEIALKSNSTFSVSVQQQQFCSCKIIQLSACLTSLTLYALKPSLYPLYLSVQTFSAVGPSGQQCKVKLLNASSCVLIKKPTVSIFLAVLIQGCFSHNCFSRHSFFSPSSSFLPLSTVCRCVTSGLVPGRGISEKPHPDDERRAVFEDATLKM